MLGNVNQTLKRGYFSLLKWNRLSAVQNSNVKVKPRLLLLEDDDNTAGLLMTLLMGYFDVHCISHGVNVFENIKKYSPRIIVSEMMMLGINGFEFSSQLRNNAETASIPFVMVNSKGVNLNKMDIFRSGAVDFWEPPFENDILSLRLYNIVEKQWQSNRKGQVADFAPAKKIVLSSLDENFLRNAAHLVNENLDNPNLNVATLSKGMALSPNKTYRKIKALTGLTAKEFIRMQRLKTAKNLLAQNKRSISEILYMVGFSSPSYFSRCFRAAYGCTPSEYVEKSVLKSDKIIF
ncbi:MAG: response regulator transcription factor [Prolixibacteraceae bacterium]|jgi:AraC-like DNA-binding protein|nr:response regulator transcription factor [Prolixibacteraceae bacterium]